jgi:hypothetical protein
VVGISIHSVLRLLVTANVPSSLILVALMMEAICLSKTSVLSRATWHNFPEDAILHSHCRKNLKSYIALIKFMNTLSTFVVEVCDFVGYCTYLQTRFV